MEKSRVESLDGLNKCVTHHLACKCREEKFRRILRVIFASDEINRITKDKIKEITSVLWSDI